MNTVRNFTLIAVIYLAPLGCGGSTGTTGGTFRAAISVSDAGVVENKTLKPYLTFANQLSARYHADKTKAVDYTVTFKPSLDTGKLTIESTLDETETGIPGVGFAKTVYSLRYVPLNGQRRYELWEGTSAENAHATTCAVKLEWSEASAKALGKGMSKVPAADQDNAGRLLLSLHGRLFGDFGPNGR